MAMYPIEACDLDLGKVVVGDDIYIHIRTANGEVAVVDLRVAYRLMVASRFCSSDGPPYTFFSPCVRKIGKSSGLTW